MLYLSYYSLNRKPFQETASPQFIWLGKKRLALFANLRDQIQEGEGLTVLTGDVGTGKTLLSNHLAETLKDQFLITKVSDPDLESTDFFNILTNSLNIDTKAGNVSTLFSNLKKTCSNKQKMLIIIDEAQRLKNSLLNDLRLLLKIKENDEQMVNILLLGQVTLNGLMKKPIQRLLHRHVASHFHLEPLTKKETADYVRHQFKLAGSGKNPFSAGALREIYRFSGGIPRLISSICDHALMVGYSRDYSVINMSVIKETAIDLQIGNEKFTKDLDRNGSIAYQDAATFENEKSRPV